MASLLNQSRGDAVVSKLPAELWIAIFEQLFSINVHLFNQNGPYRHKQMRHLQTLQLVCSLWRDLVSPLMYRHVTFEATLPFDERWETLTSDRYLGFTKSLEPDGKLDSTRASWIHTLWIYRGVFKPDYWFPDHDEALARLLSQMTTLKEVYLGIMMSRRHLEIFAHCHPPTLKKMAVGMDPQDLSTLKLLKNFPTLESLRLFVDPSVSDRLLHDTLLDDRLYLPNLRSLDIIAYWEVNYVIAWLNQSELPVITQFRLWLNDNLDLGLWSKFMRKYGTKLTTLGVLGYIVDEFGLALDLTNNVFPYTPHMLRFGLRSPDIMRKLQGLPMSVTDLVFYGFVSSLLEEYGFLGEMDAFVRRLPNNSALRTLHIAQREPSTGRDENLWENHQQYWDKEVGTDNWNKFVKNAASLLAQGIVVIDEEEVVLTDVLKKLDYL